ncbi:MAG: hydantoinase/oxoprolinase family protein [Deltaproteobacteria bacterium]|nr:hydantoinase/oxoprolinase family protein [Deltaproteobacteria bacterium]
MIRIATDVGGTFTDLVAFDEETKKLTATKVSTSVDIIRGLIETIEKSRLAPASVDFFLHGSTIAINTVIERTGAKVGLLTTQGFEDLIEIGRGNIANSFDLLFSTPEPLVPRIFRIGVVERALYTGDIRQDLDLPDAKKKISGLLAQGVEAIAVCLLHSYANPAHELALEKLIHELDPSCFVSVSSRLLRQYREYERTSTAVLNAYVGPRVKVYLGSLESHLLRSGFHGTGLIMQSNGGTMSLDVAKDQPCWTMESGPVGGTIGASVLAGSLRFENAIAFDMGGTTAKVSTIQRGEVTLTDGYYIGGYEKGFPLQLPVVDILEVGSGGGSIAYTDETGALKVGPLSAGAVPGPACYKQGNTRPTVTDADLVLGRLNPNYFLGGEIHLGLKEAEQAIESAVARALHLDLTQAAHGIVKLADTNMANAVGVMTVERGYDPREFVLVAYGGAGPCHAVSVAAELGIRKVVVPRLPGNFSAFGMLFADVKHEYVLSYVTLLSEVESTALESLFGNLEGQALDSIKKEGFREKNVLIKRALEMRYAGQEFTLVIPVLDRPLHDKSRAAIKDQFDAVYDIRYGHSFPETAGEIVSIRLEIYGLLPKPDLDCMTLDGGKGEEMFVAERNVYFDGYGFTRCKIYRRSNLTERDKIPGPAIIEEPASTTVIHPGDILTVDMMGNLIIDLKVS